MTEENGTQVPVQAEYGREDDGEEQYGVVTPPGRLVEQASPEDIEKYQKIIADRLVERINTCLNPVRYNNDELSDGFDAVETRDLEDEEVQLLLDLYANPLRAVKSMRLIDQRGEEPYGHIHLAGVFAEYNINEEQARVTIEQALKKVGTTLEEIRSYLIAKGSPLQVIGLERAWPEPQA